MDGWVRALVEAIHATPSQAVIYAAGGASQALGWLISVPGASNTVLESLTPYSRTSMTQLLGKIPTQFCSQQIAEDMALVAYNRALRLSMPGFPVVGVGFTGSLSSTRPKRGDHRFHLSTRTCNRLWSSNVTLAKGLRTREEEDKVSSQFLLMAIADACKVSASSCSGLHESEVPEQCETQYDDDQELQQVIDGKICMKIYNFSCDIQESNSEQRIILPGSFNPLHDGHLKLLEIASRICGNCIPCFEISAVNADKPPLSVAEIKTRVKQFEKLGKIVIISNQPYFYKKAELFPGSAFVIGADTAARLVNLCPNLSWTWSSHALRIGSWENSYPDKMEIMPKYYGGDHGKMLEILIGCERTGTTFLVGGRNVDGVFKVLEDLDIPEELKDMFISIPEDTFRMDISSTDIRKRMGIS